MTTSPTDIFRPVEGRTERRVAAEVVARIFESGVVPKTARNLADMTTAAGVPLIMVRAEWEKLRQGRRAPFTNAAVVPDPEQSWTPPKLTLVPEPARAKPAPDAARADAPPREDEPPTTPAKPRSKFTPKNQDKLTARNAATKAKKEPVPGKRRCCRCKKLKPRTQYRIKRKDTGQLHSMCIPCQKEYGAERYLTSKKLAKLGPVLHFVLAEGDVHAGQCCEMCGKFCMPGEEVVAADVVLHHATCVGDES